MRTLSDAARSMRRSGIREIMQIAATIPDAIHLEVGEPDFPTPPGIVDAGCQALRDGFTHYTPNAGLPTLRAAVARSLTAQGWAVGPSEVVITPGAVCALTSAVLAIVNPGDEVLLPDPGWPNYWSMTQIAGGHPVSYRLDRHDAYAPDFDDLRRKVTARSKLLFVNSPSNPTGAVFSRETIQKLMAFAVEHDLYLLSDEVYEAFVFEGLHHRVAEFDTDGRVITVSGFSKTYAMTGWRLGYAVASEPIADLIAKLQEPLVSCASAVAQKAAEAALLLPSEEIAAMRLAYRQRRDAVVEMLQPAGLLASIPRGAFYAMLDLSRAGRDSYEIARDLLASKKVAVAPGETFGESGAGMVRISLATAPDLLAEGCRRIAEYAHEHAAV